MKSATHQPSTYEKIKQSVFMGLPPTLLSFGLGHPFEVIKKRMQVDPAIRSGFSYALLMVKKNKVSTLYAAGTPTLIQTLLKDGYRIPLRGFYQASFNKHLPNVNNTTRTAMTGVMMAISDTFLLCPLERIKTWLMTHPEKGMSFMKFFTQRTENSLPIFQDLFKGFTITLLKKKVAWCSFLVPETIIRNAVINQRLDLESKSSHLTLSEKCVIGTSTGLINGMCVLPLDTIKTHVQHSDYSGKASVKRLFQVGKEQVQKYGIKKGLYPAFGINLVHYGLIGIIGADIIQRADQIWKSDQPTRARPLA